MLAKSTYVFGYILSFIYISLFIALMWYRGAAKRLILDTLPEDEKPLSPPEAAEASAEPVKDGGKVETKPAGEEAKPPPAKAPPGGDVEEGGVAAKKAGRSWWGKKEDKKVEQKAGEKKVEVKVEAGAGKQAKKDDGQFADAPEASAAQAAVPAPKV
jgi:hypothetical protein